MSVNETVSSGEARVWIIDDDEVVSSIGLSYVCRRCDVYGYLAVGELRRCWSCDTGDRLEHR